MEIIIHVDTKKLDKNSQLAVAEYTKRTSPFCKVTIKLYKSIDKISFKSGSKVYRVIPGTSSLTSEGLAKLIADNNLNGVSCIEFLVLNYDSIGDNYKVSEQDCDLEEFNLSSFSMSPELTTVVLTEQLYRAYTIMNNITYHK